MITPITMILITVIITIAFTLALIIAQATIITAMYIFRKQLAKAYMKFLFEFMNEPEVQYAMENLSK